MTKMMIVWIVLAAAFAIVEACTVQLVSIWFTIGALAALIAETLNAPPVVELIIFVAVSVAMLGLTRPFVKKFSTPKIQPTNADMYIGQDAVVTQSISNTEARGTAKVGGVEWTARSADGTEIPQGEIVTVTAIEGVKLIVKRKD
ncbi:MAG: NfeD family protein [Acutalibacteraceae bacterium]|nr:NfeD family protein [Oscillospiraceae bacterium]